MASITVRNLKDDTKKRLRVRAAENGRSLEAEARAVLDRAVLDRPISEPKTGLDLFSELRAVADRFGGFELEPFPDEILVQAAKLSGAKRRK